MPMPRNQREPPQVNRESSDIEKRPGLRERQKLEKRQRIKEAARAVFREKGFDGATVREIAERADVANATLFAYASDKRDLMMMLVNDELDAITQATGAVSYNPKLPLLDQVICLFRPRYEFWAKDPELSRYAVQQTFASLTQGEAAGAETIRFHARRPTIVAQLAALVKKKQEDGHIGSHEDASTIAWIFMAIYQAEQRQWLLATKPSVPKGLARLRSLFRVVIDGLEASRAELRET